MWNNENRGTNSLQRWQFKIRRTRQYLRGWGRHVRGKNKQEKKDIKSMIDTLDKKAEYSDLSPNELDMLRCLRDRISHLLREEEIAWFQRSKTKGLLEGDNNTKYFHLVANGKYRKSRIFQLEGNNNIIKDETELKEHITSYYQNLFGPPEENNFTMLESRIEDIPQVSDFENDILTAEFAEAEVKAAIFQMKHNKAPGPDGFPAEFYQVFWKS